MLYTFARILLALAFLGPVVLVLVKIIDTPNGYNSYQSFLATFGLPAVFAPILILLKLVAGSTLLLGIKTRTSAMVLLVIALFSAWVLGLGQHNFEVLFVYLGISGGLLLLAR